MHYQIIFTFKLLKRILILNAFAITKVIIAMFEIPCPTTIYSNIMLVLSFVSSVLCIICAYMCFNCHVTDESFDIVV